MGKLFVMEKPTCPNCGTNNRVQKAGLNGTGSQRMRCEGCHRYFTPQPKPMGHDPALKQTALRLYLEGVSLRGIGRQLGVHHQSVANWVNAYHDEQVPHQVEDTTPAETIEVDELYTYVGKKSVRRT